MSAAGAQSQGRALAFTAKMKEAFERFQLYISNVDDGRLHPELAARIVHYLLFPDEPTTKAVDERAKKLAMTDYTIVHGSLHLKTAA
jgi:hypothetical protein